MNTKQLAYPFLDNILYEVVCVDTIPDDFIKFARQSSCVAPREINNRPRYINGRKITNIAQYMQHLVCTALETDLKHKANKELKILKINQLSDGQFYSFEFPLIVWVVQLEGLDIAVNGYIWVDKSTVTI